MRGGDMTRSIILTMLAAAAIAAVATDVPRLSGGTEQVEATDGVSLALDMDITNGSGPCSPIDPERASSADEPEFKVAICLTGAALPPYALNIELLYDDTLDQCVPVDCPEGIGCLDANPDANAGTTTWTTPGLGTGCDCSAGGEFPPTCDKNPDTGPDAGVALIVCTCATPTLPVGATVSSPVAVVSFKNKAKFRDTFTLGTAALYTEEGTNIIRCPGTQCLGGATPGEEKGEGEDGGANAVLIAGIVIGAVVVVGGAGWFAYRRFRLR